MNHATPVSFCQESGAPVSRKVGKTGKKKQVYEKRGAEIERRKTGKRAHSWKHETTQWGGLVRRGLRVAKCVLLRADRQDRAGERMRR